jgi:hypothetical protein
VKSLLNRLVFTAWIVTILIQLVAAQNVKSENEIFAEEEWLRYKVKWGFIRVGSVEVIQKRMDTAGSAKFVVQIKLESAPLPFINLYCVNRSILNSSNPVNEHFNLYLGKDHQNITAYTFDQLNHKIYMSATDHGDFVRSDTLNDMQIAYDAGGIFTMMRILSAYDTTVCLPTLSEFQLKNTELVFTNETKKLKVSAVDSSVSARYFEGTAHWVGTSWAGVKGPFSGWVSADKAAVPLKIKMKISFGSVTLELEEYLRPNWPSAEGSILANETRTNGSAE